MIAFALRLRADHPELSVLLTAPTVEGLSLPDALILRPVPAERTRDIAEFLDFWRPDVALWTECDLRVELLTAAHDRRVPLLMADARTARPDPRPWRWRRGTARGLLARFSHVLLGDDVALANLKRIAGDTVKAEVAGFLEEGPMPPRCNEAERDDLAERLAGRPVWLAAGLPLAELEAVQVAGRQGLQRSHRLLLIIAPATPEEGAEMILPLKDAGWDIALRSAGEEPDRDTQVFVADGEDELGLWYRLAPITYIGGSLSGEGGRHPFEAAALGSAVIHGPNVRGHRQSYSRLAAAGATRLVRNAPELGQAVEALLAPDVTAAMAQAAWRVATTGAEVTDRVSELIVTTLEDRGKL